MILVPKTSVISDLPSQISSSSSFRSCINKSHPIAAPLNSVREPDDQGEVDASSFSSFILSFVQNVLEA